MFKKFQIIIYYTIIFALIGYLLTQQRIINDLLFSKPKTTILLILIFILSQLLNSLTYTEALRVYKQALTFAETIHLIHKSTLLNLLVPFQAGLAYRAYTLKKNKKMSLAKFTQMSLISQLYIAIFALLSSAVIVGLLFPHVRLGLWLFICPFLTIILFLLLIKPRLLIQLLPKYLQRQILIKQLLLIDQSTSFQLFKLYLISFVLQMILGTLMQQQVFSILGEHVSLLDNFYIQNIKTISSLVPILPAGLGFQEFAITTAGVSVNINMSASFNSALITRILMMLTLVPIEICFQMKKFLKKVASGWNPVLE